MTVSVPGQSSHRPAPTGLATAAGRELRDGEGPAQGSRAANAARREARDSADPLIIAMDVVQLGARISSATGTLFVAWKFVIPIL